MGLGLRARDGLGKLEGIETKGLLLVLVFSWNLLTVTKT